MTLFYCDGDAVITATSLQCSGGVVEYSFVQQLPEFIGLGITFGLSYWALFFIFSQLKKAIENL